MKRFMLTVALTCTLSVSALAGEMPTAGVASNTPPPAVSAATAPGEDANWSGCRSSGGRSAGNTGNADSGDHHLAC